MKFTKESLCARRSALSIELITLNIVLLILELKLCFGNIRQKSRVADLIPINKEFNHIISGISNI